MATLATITKKYNDLAAQLGEKTVKKFRDKKTAQRRLAELQAAYSGGKTADFNIDPAPQGERKQPREGSLRARALAKMQNGGITPEGAIDLCRVFDKERGKDTNEDTVARRGYELIRLVAISNGYGAMQTKGGRITTAA